MLCASCRSTLPWSNEPVGQETNLALVMRNNLLFIPSLTIDGRPGKFLLGSADPASVLDPRFGSGANHTLQLNERTSLRVTSVNADLHGIGDAIIGADAWDSFAVTIDYRAGLLTLQREGIHPEMMTVYRFSAEPTITVNVDGKAINAIVDTASPDTLVLPGAATGRKTARVKIADTDFGAIDVRAGGASVARVGNRLLSKFLVSIDYGKKQVGLFAY